MAGFETLDSTLTSVSAPCKDDKGPLDAFYTSEQRDAILHRLNTATLAELAVVKLLRGRKSVNIVEYRTKNGPFRTLESVVNVPLLKHKSAVTVFNSILNPVKKERKVRIQLAKFIRPEIDRSWLEVRTSTLSQADGDACSGLKHLKSVHEEAEMQPVVVIMILCLFPQDASSIVSLVCGTNKIAWTHVDRGMTVLDWQQTECPNFLRGTYMASAYLNDVSQCSRFIQRFVE